MIETPDIVIDKIWHLLEEVMDPEVPVLSVIDLGILRDVKVKGEEIEIVITPTYSGCPALDVISMNIRLKLLEHGFGKIIISQSLSPTWTTDWMSEEGKQKLKDYGIAPPNPKQQFCETGLFFEQEVIQCPRCNSYHTHCINEFGSTACKSVYRCNNCLEIFDYFKCH